MAFHSLSPERPRARTEETRGRRWRRPGPARPPPSRLAARQDLFSCKICELILASRAWSAPPSCSCPLGPCSRSLWRQAMERRRPLLHISLTITLRQTVSTPELLRHSVKRCSRAEMYQAPPPLFSVGSKVICLRHARGGGGAWERGYS